MKQPLKDLVVVSLFDGLSGGRIALSRVPHLNVLSYYSSEVDSYAIKIADKNYPQDTPYRLGDVTKVDGKALKEAISREFPNTPILLIGGSPCQGFSLAGKLKGSCTKEGIDVTSLEQYLELKAQEFEFDGQSYLFWEYIRLAYELEVSYYLLENVKVTSKWLPMFNEAMGVEPILINSSLVSAQNRQRYYWTNIPNVTQPADRGIILKDILEPIDIIYPGDPVKVPKATKKGYTEVLPGDCVDLSQPNSKTRRGRNMATKANYLLTSHEFHRYLGRPCTIREFRPTSLCHHIADADDISGNESIKRVYADSGKSPALTTMQGGHREPKILCGASRGRYLVDGVRQDAKQLTADLTEQILEVRSDEKTNCLTTVQKDSLVTIGLPEGASVPIKEVPELKNESIDKDGRAYCLTASYSGAVAWNSIEKKQRTMVPVKESTEPNPNTYNNIFYRKLTPLECERLQTLPDNYTAGVSNSQRYKMIGNGWTIEVISHILKELT